MPISCPGGWYLSNFYASLCCPCSQCPPYEAKDFGVEQCSEQYFNNQISSPHMLCRSKYENCRYAIKSVVSTTSIPLPPSTSTNSQEPENSHVSMSILVTVVVSFAIFTIVAIILLTKRQYFQSRGSEKSAKPLPDESDVNDSCTSTSDCASDSAQPSVVTVHPPPVNQDNRQEESIQTSSLPSHCVKTGSSDDAVSFCNDLPSMRKDPPPNESVDLWARRIHNPYSERQQYKNNASPEPECYHAGSASNQQPPPQQQGGVSVVGSNNVVVINSNVNSLDSFARQVRGNPPPPPPPCTDPPSYRPNSTCPPLTTCSPHPPPSSFAPFPSSSCGGGSARTVATASTAGTESTRPVHIEPSSHYDDARRQQYFADRRPLLRHSPPLDVTPSSAGGADSTLPKMTAHSDGGGGAMATQDELIRQPTVGSSTMTVDGDDESQICLLPPRDTYYRS